MRHRDVTDGDRHLEVGDPDLVEQPLCLLARSGDIAGKTGYRDQLRLRCGHARARPHNAPDIFEEGRALQLCRSTPAVDGQRERSPYPGIVEGRALGVEHDQEIGEPRAFTNLYAVAERLDEVIALRGCHTAE